MPAVKVRAERVLARDVQDQLHEHAGKWVVMTRDRLISVGDTAEEAWAKAVDSGVEDGALYRVPKKGTVFIL